MDLQTISPLSAQSRGRNPQGGIEEIFTFVGASSSTGGASEAASWNSHRRRKQHFNQTNSSRNAVRRGDVSPVAPDDPCNTRAGDSDAQRALPAPPTYRTVGSMVDNQNSVITTELDSRGNNVTKCSCPNTQQQVEPQPASHQLLKSEYKTCKSQRQKHRQNLKAHDSHAKNEEVVNRFEKFCKLVGVGAEARDLKLKFANHVGVPRMMQLKDQHKQIVQQNIRPEQAVVKESWVNPKLCEPRSASQALLKNWEAKQINKQHERQKSHQVSIFGVPFDSPEHSNQNSKVSTLMAQVPEEPPMGHILWQTEGFVPLASQMTTQGQELVSSPASPPIARFLEGQDMGIKISLMKDHISDRAYQKISSQIHTKDLEDRMKIRIPQKYLIPKETIPLKNLMKKKKNSTLVASQEMVKKTIENMRHQIWEQQSQQRSGEHYEDEIRKDEVSQLLISGRSRQRVASETNENDYLRASEEPESRYGPAHADGQWQACQVKLKHRVIRVPTMAHTEEGTPAISGAGTRCEPTLILNESNENTAERSSVMEEAHIMQMMKFKGGRYVPNEEQAYIPRTPEDAQSAASSSAQNPPFWVKDGAQRRRKQETIDVIVRRANKNNNKGAQMTCLQLPPFHAEEVEARHCQTLGHPASTSKQNSGVQVEGRINKVVISGRKHGGLRVGIQKLTARNSHTDIAGWQKESVVQPTEEQGGSNKSLGSPSSIRKHQISKLRQVYDKQEIVEVPTLSAGPGCLSAQGAGSKTTRSDFKSAPRKIFSVSLHHRKRMNYQSQGTAQGQLISSGSPSDPRNLAALQANDHQFLVSNYGGYATTSNATSKQIKIALESSPSDQQAAASSNRYQSQKPKQIQLGEKLTLDTDFKKRQLIKEAQMRGMMNHKILKHKAIDHKNMRQALRQRDQVYNFIDQYKQDIQSDFYSSILSKAKSISGETAPQSQRTA